MTFRRRFNVALIASLFIAMTAPAWGETWRGIDIDTTGWIPVTKDDDSYIFMREVPQQGRNKKVWERFEVSQPKLFSSFSTRSAVALVEYDCAGGRSRILQSTSYTGNNLKGDQKDGEPNDWSYVVPGSNDDDLFKRECVSE
jgi:hypothetical protein